MNDIVRKRGLLGVVALALASSSTIAIAQEAQPVDEPDSAGLNVIIVTAEKREENMQEVPVSITAVTAEALESSGISSVNDLPMAIPGLTFSQNGTVAQPRIRGVGSQTAQAGNENAVATYVDGVYIASSAASVLSFNNIAQVTVLRGPQGTLFGRNATGGLVQITTLDPSHDLGGKVGVTYGNLDTVGANLYLTGGLTDGLAADIAVHFHDQGDGFGTNLATGEDVNKSDVIALRSKWLLESGDTSARFIADYTKTTSANPAFRPAPGAVPSSGIPFAGGDFDVENDFEPFSEVEQWGVSLDLRHEFSGVQFSSLTAYRESDWSVALDADMSGLPFIGISASVPDEQFSQEFQLQSVGSNTFDWTVGMYYLHATGGFQPVVFDGAAILDFVQTVDSEIKTESFAVFGQGTYALSDKTGLTVGLRWTRESKDYTASQSAFVPSIDMTFPASTSGSTRDKELTWRAVLDHKFSDDFMAYASYNRGFKSGGFDNANGASADVFEPEELDAFEIGFKSELWDRRLRANAAAFYYDYKNVQLNTYDNAVPVITNGESAKIKGFEVEIQAVPVDELTIQGSLAVLDSELGDFMFEPTIALPGGGSVSGPAISAKGFNLPYSPDLTASIGFNYKIPLPTGSVQLAADYFYNDGFFALEDNRLRQDSYSLVNASIAWFVDNNEDYSIRFWGKNLGNTAYATQIGVQAGFTDFVSMAAGRTYGVSLDARF